MRDLPQYDHCDLGLISDDKTEDLRKTRKAVVPTTAQREEPTPHPIERKSSD
jgi:hypothetical protein